MSFYQTTNNAYGKPWVSTDGVHPNKPDVQVPTYKEIAEVDLSQRTGLKLLKSRIMKELDEEERPEQHTYDPCVPPPRITQLAVRAEEMKYPAQGLKGLDNPKYMTSNRDYGRVQPTQFDLPNKYFPINNKFSTHSGGERIPDTGLNTSKTPSRVHNLFDS